MKRILCVSERPHGVVAHFVFVPPPTTGTVCTRPTLHHGARPDQSERENHATGEAILDHAMSLGCDLLVKSAYTQSRLRQMIFGGATRHVLANATAIGVLNQSCLKFIDGRQYEPRLELGWSSSRSCVKARSRPKVAR